VNNSLIFRRLLVPENRIVAPGINLNLPSGAGR